MLRRRTTLAIVAVAVVVAGVLGAFFLLSPGTDDSYLQDLSEQLNVAETHLDAASAAIGECNDSLIRCLQQPVPYATRIEAAAQGLDEVRTNLSALSPPAEHASSHAQLSDGFRKVADGLNLYAEWLRDRGRDIAMFDAAMDLIRSGKEDINTSTNAILSRPVGELPLLTVMAVAVGISVVVLGVILYVLIRQLRQDNREYVEKTYATCPECGVVLDEWWTFRRRQITGWREDHLESHQKERARRGG